MKLRDTHAPGSRHLLKRAAFLSLAVTGVGLFTFLSAFAQSPTAPSALNVVFIGDSITAGVKITEKAAEELKKLKPETAVAFSNQGHSGATTLDFLPPTTKYFAPIPVEAQKLSTAQPGQLVFSIMLGTNDSANKGPSGSPVSSEVYHDNLKKIIDRLLTDFPTAKCVLNHPIWYSPNTHNSSDYEGDSAASRLKSYSPAIDTLIKEYEASKPGHVFLGDVEAYDYFAAHHETELRSENGKSGVFFLHPNEVGAHSLAKFWALAIVKVVSQ